MHVLYTRGTYVSTTIYSCPTTATYNIDLFVDTFFVLSFQFDKPPKTC